MAGQDVEPGDAEGMHKNISSYRDGYKARVAAEPETGLVTVAALAPASPADGLTEVSLLDGEGPGLEVLANTAYGGGKTRAALTAAGHAQIIKPIPLRPAVPGGFSKTTSRSTFMPARSPARPATTWPSLLAVGWCSTGAAARVHSPSAAHPPRTARR